MFKEEEKRGKRAEKEGLQRGGWTNGWQGSEGHKEERQGVA